MLTEKVRELFETQYVINKQTYRRNEHGDYVLPSIQDAWAGWKAAFEYIESQKGNQIMKPFYLLINKQANNLNWIVCNNYGIDIVTDKVYNKKSVISLRDDLQEQHPACVYKIIRCEEI